MAWFGKKEEEVSTEEEEQQEEDEKEEEEQTYTLSINIEGDEDSFEFSPLTLEEAKTLVAKIKAQMDAKPNGMVEVEFPETENNHYSYQSIRANLINKINIGKYRYRIRR